jgi:[NiFe] hydrogenase diaphorase moiety large subunit
MLMNEQARQEQWIRGLAEKYGDNRSALLPILQDVQARYSYLDTYAMQVVADMLGIHPVEVHSVASFYYFLREKPAGKFVIRLCRTISCHLQGKDRVARQLENELGVKFGETTPDGMFTLTWSECMGMCDQGPAMMVNDEIYTQVTPEKVHEILSECRSRFGVHAQMQEAK